MPSGHIDEDAEALARRFHEAYERLAPQFGYETRTESAKPWDQVPENNRGLMTAVCAEILAGRLLPPGTETEWAVECPPPARCRHELPTEQAARSVVQNGGRVVSRVVGPWEPAAGAEPGVCGDDMCNHGAFGDAGCGQPGCPRTGAK